MGKHSNLLELVTEEPDEDIGIVMDAIDRVNRLSFDTWYQSVAKLIVGWMPTIQFKRNLIYEVDEDTGSVYMGLERRRKARIHTAAATKLAGTYHAIRMAMMPKTLKIEPLDREVV